VSERPAPNAAPSRLILWLIPLALLPLPLVLNPYQQYVVNLILVYVPVAIGFNIVVGNLGLLAFSNVAFFGIGAYTTGILMERIGVPWWLAVPPAALMGALAGCAASVPALRGVRLFYLAIMTLALGELMRWVYIRWAPVTGGSFGMAVHKPELFAWVLDSDYKKFYVLLVLVLVCIVTTDRILRSRFGRAFVAIKSDELAAAAMGVPTNRYITLGFAFGGAVVGIGGAMYAALIGHLTPPAFDLTELILEFAVIMVGGLGSLVGSVVGAVVITAAPEFMHGFPGFQELLFGILIILVILLLPRGLASLFARAHPVFRDRYHRG
jgi:branched-chain amino acid transport system permease protein